MSERVYFQCKIRFEKDCGGTTKKVTEDYLIDGEDYAQAYTRFIREMEPFIRNISFEVTSMVKIKFAEIIDLDKEANFWFKVQRSCTILTGKKCKEKTVKEVILVHAMDIRLAINKLYQSSPNAPEYDYKKLEKTTISDVFIHMINK